MDGTVLKPGWLQQRLFVNAKQYEIMVRTHYLFKHVERTKRYEKLDELIAFLERLDAEE